MQIGVVNPRPFLYGIFRVISVRRPRSPRFYLVTVVSIVSWEGGGLDVPEKPPLLRVLPEAHPI
jgi:hypothetical protein